MGRADPLTVQALGRSPYDDVVPGTGSADPRAPRQAYDLRGRPFNLETRRINRDIVKAHNDVMLVIGVAEATVPAAAAGPSSDDEWTRAHRAREFTTGRTVLRVGRVAELAGVWGVAGMRQRILLFRRYATVPFVGLVSHELERRSRWSLLLGGLPVVAAVDVTRAATEEWLPAVWDLVWVRRLNAYIQLHILLYSTLQRLDLVPTATLFPPLGFFIPFTAASPIPPLPPLGGYSAGCLARWAGAALMGIVPFASFIGTRYLWGKATTLLFVWIYNRLPTISAGPMDPGHAKLVVDQLTPTQHQQQNGHRPRRDGSPADPPPGVESTPPPPPPPASPPPAGANQIDDALTAVTDDESSTEGPSAPVISFDLEPADATDTPPGGLWSAELRASYGPEEARGGGSGPGLPAGSPSSSAAVSSSSSGEEAYMDTLLTRIPTVFATHILSVATTTALVIPLETVSLRLLARAWWSRHGGTGPDAVALLDSMYRVTELSGLATTWCGLTNIIGVAWIRFLISMEVWAAVSLAAERLHMPEAVWRQQAEQREEETRQEMRRREEWTGEESRGGQSTEEQRSGEQRQGEEGVGGGETAT